LFNICFMVLDGLINFIKTIFMKTFLYSLSVLFFIALIVSCGKEDTEGAGKNGIYLEGNSILSFKSAFFRGSSPTPDRTGSHLFIFEKDFSKQPDWKQVTASFEVGAIRYNDKDYTTPGSDIVSVIIRLPQSISGLGNGFSFNLEDGKYKGGCDKVYDVRVLSYDVSVSNGSHINIEIILTDGRVLSILYNGKTLLDDRV